MRESTYEGLKPVLDAQMSKMSPEQRVAMASLNEEAKKREAEKLKWDEHQAQKEKEIMTTPHETIVPGSLTPDEEKCLPDPLAPVEGYDPRVDREGAYLKTNSLRYTQATLADEFARIFEIEIMALRNAGQKEYAHDDSSPFANFERGAKDMGIDRKQVLWVYAMKHKDGIAAHLKGQVSQREDVRGRVNDLIVYLLLLRGILNEEAGNTGNFGLGDLG